LASFGGGLVECLNTTVYGLKQTIDAFLRLGSSFLHGEAFSLNLLKNQAFSLFGQKG
jgi:hypothetical protein